MPNWSAAFDITVASPLNSNTLNEAGATGGSAAGNAEARKHTANNEKYRELGWVSVPLVVETYGFGMKKHSAQFPVWQPAWPCSCIAASQWPSETSIRD